MDVQETIWCPRCNKRVVAHQPKINHTLHLVLTVLTCGLWLAVWLYFAMSDSETWRCSECGRGIKRRKPTVSASKKRAEAVRG